MCIRDSINVYTIDAIDLAAKIGMGKRTNTILPVSYTHLRRSSPRPRP